MKRNKAFWLGELLIVVSIGSLFGVMALGILIHAHQDSARREPRPTTAVDAKPTFSKWGEAKITSEMWEGTRVWQFRTNAETGEVEGRCQVICAGGGYK